MMDDMNKYPPGKATDGMTLEARLLDLNVPKTEREHWAADEIKRLRDNLVTAEAERAALKTALVDAIFHKKLTEGYKVDAAEMHAKAFVDWSLTQLRNELALIERDE